MSVIKKSFPIILAFFFLCFIACKKTQYGKVGTDLKPVMGLVGTDEVAMNGKLIKIDDLQKELIALRTKIGPPMQDSIAVQFELEQGVDKKALERVKEQLTAAGIYDLKFIVPFN